MPDSNTVEGVSTIDVIEATYIETNRYANLLQIDVANGKRGKDLIPHFDLFRYYFLELYGMTGHRQEFDEGLRKSIRNWSKRATPPTTPTKFYVLSLKLYDMFKKQLALSSLIK